MKLKIKEEYLDGMIFCPFTYRNKFVRLISEDMYQLYFNKGFFLHLFEEDKPIQKTIIKEIKPTDDLSESRD